MQALAIVAMSLIGLCMAFSALSVTADGSPATLATWACAWLLAAILYSVDAMRQDARRK